MYFGITAQIVGMSIHESDEECKDLKRTYYRILKNEEKGGDYKYGIEGRQNMETLMEKVIKKCDLNENYNSDLKRSVEYFFKYKDKHKKKYNKHQEEKMQKIYAKNVKQNFKNKQNNIGENNIVYNFATAETVLNYAFKNDYEIVDIVVDPSESTYITKYNTKENNYCDCTVYYSNNVIISNRRKLVRNVIEDLISKGANLNINHLDTFISHNITRIFNCCSQCNIEIKSPYTNSELEDIINLFAEHSVLFH